MVLKARLLDVMGADGFGRRRAAVGTEPWNIPLLGGRDEVEPAKKLVGAARRWEETQENAGSWEPDEHQLLKEERVEHRPLGPATCRSLRTVTRAFLWREGQACLERVEEREVEKKRKSVDSLCEVRGAGPTEAFKEDWEEAAIEGKRLEEAGRVVGWRQVTDFWARALEVLSWKTVRGGWAVVSGSMQGGHSLAWPSQLLVARNIMGPR